MRGHGVHVGWRWFLGSLLGLVVLGGCSDPSRQTGTMVQESEEAKAQIEDMREMYQDMERPE